MARLNEPPVLGDPLEALKRRFIRQNREIARANSTQSAKIRTLECETSRLLSENITLREENIKLQKSLEQAQSRNGLGTVSVVKDKLESKVQELNELIVELTQVTNGKHPSLGLQQARRKPARQSLYQRTRPTTAELAEIAIAEGRLPVIVEDKASPQKTLSAEVMRPPIPDWSNLTDSPELGPPPVAHFDEGDPTKRSVSNKESLAVSPSKDTGLRKNLEHETNFHSSNLETRRRRKETGLVRHAAEINTTEDGKPQSSDKPSDSIDSQQAAKVGSKRKFGAREEDSKPLTKSASQQDLNSTRHREESESMIRGLSRSKSHVNLSSAVGVKNRTDPISNSATQSRRALGEKSVNTDPVVSPAKTRTSSQKPLNSKNDETNKPRDRDSSKEKSTIRQIRPIRPPPSSLRPTADESNREPATPIPTDDDIFSPDSLQPSTTRAESRDTPPPADLHAANDAARPSRRQRSAVSYAEPNLRDKMRRPGKEMVDAVSGLQRSRLSQSDTALREDYLSSASQSELFKAKIEDNMSMKWHDQSAGSKEPTSPLAARSSTIALPSSETLSKNFLEERTHRRSSALHRQTTSVEEPERRVSASQETIAALISTSNKKLARVGSANFAGTGERDMSSLAESLSVFDLHLSSPSTAEPDATTHLVSKPRVGRPPKRHSSVSEGLSRMARVNQKERERERERQREREASSRQAPAPETDGKNEEKTSGRAERAGRRRSMMV